jgi:hypothetical protein
LITLPQNQPVVPGRLPGAPAGGLPSLGNRQQVQNQLAAMKPPVAPQPMPQGMPAPAPMMPPQQQAPQPPQPIDEDSLPQLHDVVLIRTKKIGKIVIENIDPAAFIVDPNAKTLNESFCGYRVQRTLSELKEAGYKNIDALTDDLDGGDPSLAEEVLVRNRDTDVQIWKGAEYGDPSTRKVWITCLWIRLDADQDGIAEWRYIVRAGNRILENVASTEPPIAFLTPHIKAHSLIGESLAEKAMPLQKLNTTILRAQIDNVNLSINNRLLVDGEKVNLSDLMDSRPGGIVRVEPGQLANAVAPMPGASGDQAGAANLLAYIADAKNDRTGISRLSQGIDADAINATAATVENLTARSDAQMKRIIRTFAETGVKDLFRIVQRFLSEYQDKNMVLKLRNKWVDVDPRAWRNQYSLSCVVGLGTGDKTKDARNFTTLAQIQQQALQANAPFVTPANLYKTLQKLTTSLGVTNPEEYWTDPSTVPPQQPQAPQPDPQLALVAAESQAEAAKIQLTHQLKMAEMQAKANFDAAAAQREQDKAVADIKLQALLETHKAQLVDARERDKAAADQQAERQRMLLDATIQREKVIWANNGTTPADEAAAFQSIESSLQNVVQE